MHNYRKLVSALKGAYSHYDISVRRRPISDHGRCKKKGRKFLIEIDSRLDEVGAIDTLIHEIPHVPAWSEWVETGEHGIIWAEHYRRCYMIYERELCNG